MSVRLYGTGTIGTSLLRGGAMKIDWNEPYGKICGKPPVPGALYEQGGMYFTSLGDGIELNASDNEILELVRSGMSHTQVGEKLGITRQKVTSVMKKV